MSFEEARAYVQQKGVASREEYFELRKSEDLMNGLPPNPAVVYASYWKGWDDFLWDEELSEDIELLEDTELLGDTELSKDVDLLMEKINIFLNE